MQLSAQTYRTEIVPKLMERFGWKNIHQVPRIQKVTLNVGLSKALKDPRFMEVIESTLTRITGQKPIKTLSRVSIANFKIRQGLVIGMKVTLRGKRMWQFLDRMANVSFARVRDFRGVPSSAVDTQGNFSYGFTEHTAFPEISPDEIDYVHGLQVNITTSAKSQEEGRAVFELLGFPFSAKGGSASGGKKTVK